VVNDYHVRLQADSNIAASLRVPFDPFTDAQIQVSGTKDVLFNWSGATVNQNDSISVGFGTVGAMAPVNLRITES
jgi:hypothetical protein